MLSSIENKYKHNKKDITKWMNDEVHYDQEMNRAKSTATNATVFPALIVGFVVLGAIMNFLGINLTDYTDADLESFSDPMVDPIWLVVISLVGSAAWFTLGHLLAKKREKSANAKYRDSMTKLYKYRSDMVYVNGLKTKAQTNLKNRLGIDTQTVFGGVKADAIAQKKIADTGIEQLISGIKNNTGKDIAIAKKNLAVVKPETIQECSAHQAARKLTYEQQKIFDSIMQQFLQNKK